MHRLKALFTSLVVLASLTGCKVFDPEEEIPAYITIQNGQYQQDITGGNFLTDQGLKDVWVYKNGLLQGIYELPATFPVLEPEKNTIRLRGGIYESGLSAFHLPYHFWEILDYAPTLAPGDTAVIEPVFNYVDNSLYELKVNETFENQDVNFAPFAYFQSDTARILKSSIDPFKGNTVGKVHFDDDSRHFEVASINPNPLNLLPANDTYLEITYKSGVALAVGLVYQNTNEGVGIYNAIVLNPKNEWTTVFVHLVDGIRQRSTTDTDYNIWLYADGGGETTDLFLDEIRLITVK